MRRNGCRERSRHAEASPERRTMIVGHFHTERDRRSIGGIPAMTPQPSGVSALRACPRLPNFNFQFPSLVTNGATLHGLFRF